MYFRSSFTEPSVCTAFQQRKRPRSRSPLARLINRKFASSNLAEKDPRGLAIFAHLLPRAPTPGKLRMQTNLTNQPRRKILAYGSASNRPSSKTVSAPKNPVALALNLETCIIPETDQKFQQVSNFIIVRGHLSSIWNYFKTLALKVTSQRNSNSYGLISKDFPSTQNLKFSFRELQWPENRKMGMWRCICVRILVHVTRQDYNHKQWESPKSPVEEYGVCFRVPCSRA